MADRKNTQLFPKYFNTIAKVSIVTLLLVVAGVLFGFDQIQRSPYVTEVGWVRDQPVPFSHEHHVSGLGIDCRYCHKFADKGAVAGIPPVSTCMNCHSQIWADSPMLEPVREAYAEKKPIPWVRVHDLPEFAYFDHSIHLAKGMGCTTCHGPVHEMPLMWKANTLYMSWCLECHRNPEKYVRGTEKIYELDWPPVNRKIGLIDDLMGGHSEEGHGDTHGELVDGHGAMTPVHPTGEDLIHKNNINVGLQHCSVCHR